MRAVRFYGKQDIRVDEIPEPTYLPGQVIVAPAYCGICGSDLHEYLHGPLEYPATPHPLTGEKVPLTLGHEFSGVVVAVGADVKTLAKGDRVTVDGSLWCGECEPCQNGIYNVCVKGGTVGQHGKGGGLAERVVCEEQWCYKIPEHVGLDVAALSEPLAVAEHAFRQVQPSPAQDQYILVLGCGAIGLGVVQVLHYHGYRRIFAFEMSQARRQLALELGASQAFDPQQANTIDQLLAVTDGLGPHTIIDCAGVQNSVQTAYDVVRTHGTIIEVALTTSSIALRPNPMVFKEITYRGSLSYNADDWLNVTQMLSKDCERVKKMITKIVPLERTIEDGIVGLARADEGLIKTLVEVNSPKSLEELI